MNKTLKRVLSLAAASAMSLTLAVTTVSPFVYAENDQTVTITDSNGATSGTYSAYKLFNVTASGNEASGKKYTYSIISGAAINDAFKDSTVYGTLDITAADVKSAKTSDDYATIVLDKLTALTGTSGWTDDSANVQKFADAVARYVLTHSADISKTTTINLSNDNNKLDYGYYLVLEDSANDTGDETKSAAMLDTSDAVDGTVTFTTKESTPTVEKKVQEKNDSVTESTTDPKNPTDWQDAADYDFNDQICYRLKGTLPSDYASYKTYNYIFTDTLSKGLTYNNDVQVYVVDNANSVTDTFEDSTTLSNYHNVTSWFTKVTENYSGTQDTDKYKGGTVLTLTCSDLKKANEADTTVELTKDSAFIVRYTATLNGAAEMGSTGNPNKVTLTYSNNPYSTSTGDTTTTPEDEVTVYTYKIEPIKYANSKADNNKLSGAIFELYKKGGVTRKDSSGTDFTQTDTTYSAGTGYTLVAKVTTATDGLITFNRIDAGDYILHEAYAPAGYKTVSDISFTVSATYDTNMDDTNTVSYGLSVTNLNGGTLSVNDDKSTITGDIIDTSSSKLPKTGGIGTTIFYVCGGSLVAIAAALLIAKKRASAE